MRKIGWFGLFLVLASSAHAQVGVGLELPRREFILFEPLVASVTLLNSSGKNLIFEENEPWLQFLVTRNDVELIDATGSPLVTKDIYLNAASTTTVPVNLTYTHEIRQAGSYQVQARVRHRGHTYVSQISRFNVVNGAVQWKQHFVYINPKTQKEETRFYELVAQQADHGNRLLARIRDPNSRRVMCCTPIGDLIGYGEPSVKVDSGGTFHILNQNSPRHFDYSKISPEGIREKPRSFVTIGGIPALIETADEGVMVVGGTEIGDDGKVLSFDRGPAPPPSPVPAKTVTLDEVEDEED